MLHALVALAEPNRLRIVELLRDGPQSVNGIGRSLQLNQPQVSKHLRVLRDAGLVKVEARAQTRIYALRTRPFRQLDTWLEPYRALWLGRHADPTARTDPTGSGASSERALTPAGDAAEHR